MTNTNVPPKITDASVTISWSPDGTTNSGAYFGYCTVKQVEARIALLNVMANNLTSSQAGIHPIGEAITFEAIRLQLLVNHVYSMPYTGSDATILGMLADMNVLLAMAWLWERSFISNEPNTSNAPAIWRTEVAGVIDDLKSGLIIWYPPYGDATPNPMAPIYDLSQGATIWPPDPSYDLYGDNLPYFTMSGRTVWKPNRTA